ncbi:MAG: DUF86 domain-containing protein [candidate division KSB1 bacterium]|nr:DUF86 domain-containing protein [candidate division KSB1 bacterium]MDZ7367080.1 DUF86 domain-containing protein [candidate division KSB1 bacterium]MDZ7405058.1 DUF86 domain-containing protein [candidate division KSB1 bacterium]
MLPDNLAKRLAEAAGMRNLLVHDYAKVDLKIIHKYWSRFEEFQ